MGRPPAFACRYRAGVITADRLIAIVDRHGDALEREIARKAIKDFAEFQRTINRAEVLAGYVSTGWRHSNG